MERLNEQTLLLIMDSFSKIYEQSIHQLKTRSCERVRNIEMRIYNEHQNNDPDNFQCADWLGGSFQMEIQDNREVE